MNSGSLIFTSILMWFGRLELLTAIIVLHPHSWRRQEKADGERQAMAMVKRILDREDSED
jgi:Trk-type K+ transport system membrane component